MDPKKITCGILAGGRSSRMGTDKLLLPFGKESMIRRIAGRCAGFAEVVISTDTPEHARRLALPYRTVCDEKQGFGPAEGLRMLLGASGTDTLLLLAGDMPGITEEFLVRLADAMREGEPGLLVTCGGFAEPCCSLYTRRLLPRLERMEAEGEHALRHVFDGSGVRKLPVEEMGFFPEVLFNVNTPREYARLAGEREA